MEKMRCRASTAPRQEHSFVSNRKSTSRLCHAGTPKSGAPFSPAARREDRRELLRRSPRTLRDERLVRDDSVSGHVPTPQLLLREVDSTEPHVDIVQFNVICAGEHPLSSFRNREHRLFAALGKGDQRVAPARERVNLPQNLAVTEPEPRLRKPEAIEEGLEIVRAVGDEFENALLDHSKAVTGGGKARGMEGESFAK